MSAGGRRPGRPTKLGAGSPETGFGQTIFDYLERLGWNQAELSKRTGISKSQISGWLSKGDRAIARDDVCRIVWAIAGGLDGVIGDQPPPRSQRTGTMENPNENGGTLEGRAFLDQLLNKCLQSAGYAPETSPNPVDQIWRLRFSPSEKFDDFEGETGEKTKDWKPELRVGWVLWPAFAEAKETGYAADITEQICRYLGARKPKYIHLDPEEVPSAIQSRRVDFVAPVLIQFPRRLVYLRFSTQIPLISVGIKAVTRRGNEGRDSSKYRPNVIGGEVGETMAGFLFPDEDIRPTRFSTLQEALEKLDKQPIDPLTERMRCLVIDDITYCGLKTDKRYMHFNIDDANIPGTENILRDEFPIGFAVHPDEPNLLNAINMCVDILDRNGFFTRLYQRINDSHPMLAQEIGIQQRISAVAEDMPSVGTSDENVPGVARRTGSGHRKP